MEGTYATSRSVSTHHHPSSEIKLFVVRPPASRACRPELDRVAGVGGSEGLGRGRGFVTATPRPPPPLLN